MSDEWAFWKNLQLNKPTPYRNQDYMAWVRTWPCMVCGSSETEAAHTGPHGMRTKASDFRCLPLCALHHRDDRFGLDKMGPEGFEKLHNIDLKATVLQLVEIYLSKGCTL